MSQSPQWFGALTPAKKRLSVCVIEQFDIVQLCTCRISSSDNVTVFINQISNEEWAS